MFGGLIIFHITFPTYIVNMRIFHGILSVPRNIVMDVNNIMVNNYTCPILLITKVTSFPQLHHLAHLPNINTKSTRVSLHHLQVSWKQIPTYSPPTLAGAGYQRTIPTSKGHWLQPLLVVTVRWWPGTNKCGWGISHSITFYGGGY